MFLVSLFLFIDASSRFFPDIFSLFVLGGCNYLYQVPKHMQDMNDNAKKELLYGDRLLFLAFNNACDRHWTLGDNLEFFFITTILNFQRQFHACKLAYKIPSFEGQLLGKASNKSIYKSASDIDAECESKSIGGDGVAAGFECPDATENSTDEKLTSEQTDSALFRIPRLNESQQKAVDDFNSGADVNRIAIVQGYIR